MWPPLGLHSHMPACFAPASPVSPCALCFVSLSPYPLLSYGGSLPTGPEGTGIHTTHRAPKNLSFLHKINNCTIHILYFFHLAQTPKTIGMEWSRRVSFLEFKSSSQSTVFQCLANNMITFFFFSFKSLIILSLNFHICIINLAILCPGEFPPLNRLYSALFS